MTLTRPVVGDEPHIPQVCLFRGESSQAFILGQTAYLATPHSKCWHSEYLQHVGAGDVQTMPNLNWCFKGAGVVL